MTFQITTAILISLGRLIGSVLGQIVSTRMTYRKDVSKLAVECAKIDFEQHIGSESASLPMSASLAFYHTYFASLEKGMAPEKATEAGLLSIEKTIAVCLASPFEHYEKYRDLLPEKATPDKKA